MPLTTQIRHVSPVFYHCVQVIFDNPDVTRGRLWCHNVALGGMGQLFKLTFLFSALKGITP